jgi:predicted phage gp36 major capsid-like protein
MEFLRDDYTGWADGVVYMNMWSQFGGVVVDPDAFVGLIPGE